MSSMMREAPTSSFSRSHRRRETALSKQSENTPPAATDATKPPKDAAEKQLVKLAPRELALRQAPGRGYRVARVRKGRNPSPAPTEDIPRPHEMIPRSAHDVTTMTTLPSLVMIPYVGGLTAFGLGPNMNTADAVARKHRQDLAETRRQSEKANLHDQMAQAGGQVQAKLDAMLEHAEEQLAGARHLTDIVQTAAANNILTNIKTIHGIEEVQDAKRRTDVEKEKQARVKQSEREETVHLAMVAHKEERRQRGIKNRGTTKKDHVEDYHQKCLKQADRWQEVSHDWYEGRAQEDLEHYTYTNRNADMVCSEGEESNGQGGVKQYSRARRVGRGAASPARIEAPPERKLLGNRSAADPGMSKKPRRIRGHSTVIPG